jgi:hypothetical protein
LRLHGNNGYTNAPLCNVARTLSILLLYSYTDSSEMTFSSLYVTWCGIPLLRTQQRAMLLVAKRLHARQLEYCIASWADLL